MNYKRDRLKLNNGTAEIITIQTNDQNSLTRQNMLELEKILEEIKNDDSIRAAVLTSENSKFFCNGLDAENVLKAPRDKLMEEVGQIVVLFGHMIRFDKPLIVEVTGYAMGGGAVFTVAGDYKYMVEGKARIAFTEVLMGLPLPPSFMEKIRMTVKPEFMNEICLEGCNYKAAEAKGIGLITDVADSAEAVRKLTLKKLDTLFRVPTSAFRKTKMALNGDLIARMDEYIATSGRNFQDPIVVYNLLEGMNALKDKRRPVFQ